MTTSKDCRNGKGCLSPVKDYKIEEVISHPDYFKTELRNDIALIRVDEDVQLTFGKIGKKIFGKNISKLIKIFFFLKRFNLFVCQLTKKNMKEIWRVKKSS